MPKWIGCSYEICIFCFLLLGLCYYIFGRVKPISSHNTTLLLLILFISIKEHKEKGAGGLADLDDKNPYFEYF